MLKMYLSKPVLSHGQSLAGCRFLSYRLLMQALYLLQGASNGVSVALGGYLLQSLYQLNGCLVMFQTRCVEVLK